jgi:hypothetical protein
MDNYDISYRSLFRFVKVVQFKLFISIIIYLTLNNIIKINFIAGTGLLWWTYVDIKHKLDSTHPSELLEESVRNEKAFLTLAIIASVITVRFFFFINLKIYKYIFIFYIIDYHYY